MNLPRLGSLAQLRSGGPVMTVVSVRRKTGRVVCVWFQPGSAKWFRVQFRADCLSAEGRKGVICEKGGLWGQWRQRQAGSRAHMQLAPTWAPPQPWWIVDPRDFTDGESGEWSDDDEHFDDEDEEQYEDDDRAVDHDDFVDEMDIDSESYARAHEDGWFYGDDDPDEVSSDDEDGDDDYSDYADDDDD